MIFQGMLIIMLVAVVIYFVLKFWSMISGSDDGDSFDSQIEEKK